MDRLTNIVKQQVCAYKAARKLQAHTSDADFPDQSLDFGVDEGEDARQREGAAELALRESLRATAEGEADHSVSLLAYIESGKADLGPSAHPDVMAAVSAIMMDLMQAVTQGGGHLASPAAARELFVHSVIVQTGKILPHKWEDVLDTVEKLRFGDRYKILTNVAGAHRALLDTSFDRRTLILHKSKFFAHLCVQLGNIEVRVHRGNATECSKYLPAMIMDLIKQLLNSSDEEIVSLSAAMTAANATGLQKFEQVLAKLISCFVACETAVDEFSPQDYNAKVARASAEMGKAASAADMQKIADELHGGTRLVTIHLDAALFSEKRADGIAAVLAAYEGQNKDSQVHSDTCRRNLELVIATRRSSSGVDNWTWNFSL